MALRLPLLRLSRRFVDGRPPHSVGVNSIQSQTPALVPRAQGRGAVFRLPRFGAPMFSFAVPSYRRCGWPFRASCSCRGISSPVVCRDGRRERTRSPFVECSSGECPAFSQRVRATALFPSVIGSGGLQTMGVMKQEDGQLFKCRARNPFAPCAGFFAHFSNLFTRSSAST